MRLDQVHRLNICPRMCAAMHGAAQRQHTNWPEPGARTAAKDVRERSILTRHACLRDLSLDIIVGYGSSRKARFMTLEAPPSHNLNQHLANEWASHDLRTGPCKTEELRTALASPRMQTRLC